MKKSIVVYLKDEVKSRVIVSVEIKDSDELKTTLLAWGTHGMFIGDMYYPPHKIDKCVLPSTVGEKIK